MRSVALSCAFLLVGFLPSVAQKIETQASDRTQIVRLKTALDHLTVIELGEPVLEVAAGSSAFKVEWRENKVFVQPTESSTATNLFIWTAKQRLNYELEPASSVANMDFAVDELAIHPEPIVSPSAQARQTKLVTSDLLFVARAVRAPASNSHVEKPVEVWIRDLYEYEGNLLVRYTVLNHRAAEYAMPTPQVFKLDGVRSRQSLYTMTNSQLDDDQASKLKITRRIPVKVLMKEVQSEKLRPGEQATGIISIATASTSEPTVLSFEFPPAEMSPQGSKGQPKITAYLVH